MSKRIFMITGSGKMHFKCCSIGRTFVNVTTKPILKNLALDQPRAYILI